jgi:hypothetical protein
MQLGGDIGEGDGRVRQRQLAQTRAQHVLTEAVYV